MSILCRAKDKTAGNDVMNIAAVTFLTFYVLRYFVNQNEIVKQKLKEEQTLLAAEREKSENLLLNILPVSIAKRSKNGDTVIADEHSEAAAFLPILSALITNRNISNLIFW